ncbi:MAG: hypothetical protein KME36_11085 [Candidatus Thiodiazotropha sp. (ex Lucina pensylvanica)]|nr:hypothetical protein [Candidatus Thiodiazotropha sp. (ex Lucina pensylvanica)]MBT3050646.1 hypothetical protein [Candidatus Thiodiazotropha sp. (ex Codakia orbicularis)]
MKMKQLRKLLKIVLSTIIRMPLSHLGVAALTFLMTFMFWSGWQIVIASMDYGFTEIRLECISTNGDKSGRVILRRYIRESEDVRGISPTD